MFLRQSVSSATANFADSATIAHVLIPNVCMQGPPDWHPAPAPVKEAAAKAAKHAQERGTDLAKLAIGEFVRLACLGEHNANPEMLTHKDSCAC